MPEQDVLLRGLPRVFCRNEDYALRREQPMRNKVIVFGVLLALGFAGCLMNEGFAETDPAAEGMTLAAAGVARADVIVAEDAAAPVQHAAAE